MFNKDILKAIGDELKGKELSVSVAESVTSGLVQCAISNIPDASLFFQGGMTVYNVGQKCRHLLVEPLHAIACNSVSQRVATDLARNVCDLFTSDYGIGVVGYAATMPEKGINSLFCYFAIALQGKVIRSGRIDSTEEEGFTTQLYYTSKLIDHFLAELRAGKQSPVAD